MAKPHNWTYDRHKDGDFCLDCGIKFDEYERKIPDNTPYPQDCDFCLVQKILES